MSDKHPREGWEQQIQSIQKKLDMNPEGVSMHLTDFWGDAMAEIIEYKPTGEEMAITLLNIVNEDIKYYQGHADRLREFKKELLVQLEDSRAHDIID